jgi:pyruvate/2-oxoglutarate dehydrogenase complex dihydrolipoamide acyltransferase (E2) component
MAPVCLPPERPSGVRSRVRLDRVDFADGWLGGGLRVIQENTPGLFVWLDVDMTYARAAVERLRRSGIRGSYAAVIARAAAIALARNPDLHLLQVGALRPRPRRVRIGLSAVSDEASSTLRLEAVEDKPLAVLSEEIAQRGTEARTGESCAQAKRRRWGWLAPFGWMRRVLMRLTLSLQLVRRRFGSLQVAVVPGLDGVASFASGTNAVLGMGQVAERVVARHGEPAVRLMATITCAGDRKVWDGAAIARLMGEIRGILESNDLLAEAYEATGLDDDEDDIADAEAAGVMPF